MIPLRQSTSAVIWLGPFTDAAGAVQTGLAIANTDVRVRKAGATTAVSKTAGGATHDANGRYYATLDATDTNTPGPLRVDCQIAGTLPEWRQYVVLPAAVYDALYAGTGDGVRADVRAVAAGVITASQAPALAYLDAPVSTRSTYAGGDTAGTATLLDRLTAARAGYFDKLNVSGTLAHSDAAATYRADVSGLATRASVDALPSAADVAAAVWAAGTRTLTGFGTLVADVAAGVWGAAARTLTAFGFTVAPTAAQNADALLGRSLAGGADGGRTVRQALAASRNRVGRAGNVLTVYAEDDVTPLWTATITTDPAAELMTGIDPS